VNVEELGSGPRIVLVHGSVTPGWMTWNPQRPLARDFTLVVPIRTGYPPNPPLDRIDFEDQAAELRSLLRPGDHLVGHSYGGVVSLLAAAGAPLGSLVVIEPPALDVARGQPEVEAFRSCFAEGVPTEPRAYLDFFLPLVGTSIPLPDPPDPLPPQLEAGARAAIAERSPHEAVIPLDTLASEPYPKLVISGGHNPAFEAVCDVLEERLGATRAVLQGAGHAVQRTAGFNDALAQFLALTAGVRPRNESSTGSGPKAR
jgi:pimeloyl-ACP methyl ester carboxylesterase